MKVYRGETCRLRQFDDNNALLATRDGSYVFHAPSLKVARVDGGAGSPPAAPLPAGLQAAESPGTLERWRSAHEEKAGCLRALTLNLTDACNLRCTYCYRSGTRRFPMSERVALGSIDTFLSALGTDGSQKSIEFSGGEPLLALPLLRAAIRHARMALAGSRQRVLLGLVTNGTLLSERVFDDLQENEVHVTVSLDGERRIHDASRLRSDRAGSHAEILRNIAPILLRRPPGLSGRATITPRFPYPARVLRYLETLGFHDVSFEVALGGRADALGIWVEDGFARYDRSLGRYMGHVFEGMMRGKAPVLTTLPNQLHRIHARRARVSPCRMSTALLVVSPEGRFWPCYRLCDDARFCIGDASSGLDEAKRRALFPRLAFEKEPCLRCWARTLCGGGCPASAFLSDGTDLRADPRICRSRLLLWKWILWLYVRLRQAGYAFESETGGTGAALQGQPTHRDHRPDSRHSVPPRPAAHGAVAADVS